MALLYDFFIYGQTQSRTQLFFLSKFSYYFERKSINHKQLEMHWYKFSTVATDALWPLY